MSTIMMSCCKAAAARSVVRSSQQSHIHLQQALLHQQASCSFSSSTRQRKTPADFVFDQEPARAARQAAEESSRRKNVGPFPMGQPAQDAPPRRPWQDLGGGEKLGRTVANSSNLLVVVFGITISGLIIYAVSSELWATNSPTKIFDQCTEILKKNDELKSVLREPIRFHAESSGGRRNRRVLSTHSVDPKTHRERMTIRFAVEGKSPDAPADESYWHKVKRWIRPIVVEPSDASALIPTPPDRGRVEKPVDDAPSSGSWLGSAFGSLLPSSFGGKTTSSPAPPPSTRMRTRPSKGYFSGGEAIAVLLLNDAGAFELQTLTVYYPSAQDWQWKTDVRSAGSRTPQTPENANQPEAQPTRYRFWHR